MDLLTESSSKFSNVESWVLALAVTTNIVTVNASTCSCPSSPMFYRIQPDVDVQLGWAPLLTARPFPNSKSNPTRPSYQLAPFRQAPSTDAPIPTYDIFIPNFLLVLFCDNSKGANCRHVGLQKCDNASVNRGVTSHEHEQKVNSSPMDPKTLGILQRHISLN